MAAIVLAGCAASPMETGDREVAAHGPAHVLSGEAGPGETVIWGGEIVEVINRAESTELVVVSRPLDRADRPRLEAEGGVRFVAVYPGFLEPVTHAPGRFVTLLGAVDGIEQRHVGEFPVRHPVLAVDQLHLWPADPRQWDQRPRFSIGVGIRL